MPDMPIPEDEEAWENLTHEDAVRIIDELEAEIDRLMDAAYRDRYTTQLRKAGCPEEKIPSLVAGLMSELVDDAYPRNAP